MFSLSQQVKKTRRSARAPAVLTGLALACIWAAVPVAGAQAATAGSACPETTLVHPFVAWGDSGYYSLVPGGSFELGEPRWSYAGGAGAAVGAEPYDVTGAPDWFSLVLPEGGSAQTSFMCVEPSDRTFRFFVRAVGPSATLSLRLIYRTVLGVPLVVASKAFTVGNSLELSPALHTGAAVASNISGGSAQLALGFGSAKGIVRIDDVYLDPRMRR
jgi:hypothetical protein